MSTAYEQTGRTDQKQRTRQALVDAARRLIARGGTPPTVAEAAAEAGVSRPTAYRYFATQHALVIAAHPEIDTTSMLPDGAGEDVEARVEAVLRRMLAMVLETEAQQRTMLRLSLTPGVDPRDLPLRQGRAIGWIEEALEPLSDSLGAASVRRLAVAIRATAGIEALVWLTDVAGLSRKRAVEQMLGNARAIVRQARDDHGESRPKRSQS